MTLLSDDKKITETTANIVFFRKTLSFCCLYLFILNYFFVTIWIFSLSDALILSL